MKNPQVIFFDAVGTLFGISGTVGGIYGRFAQAAGVEADPDALDKAFMQSFSAAPKPIFMHPNPNLAQLEYEWWRLVAFQSFERIGALSKIEDFDKFFRPLFDHFALADPWCVYPEVRQTLSALRSAGIELGIISDFDSRLFAVLKALDLASWFSSITISTHVGTAKPERGIFEAALANHSLRPDQCWHVGDSWSEDYQGAIAAGLQGIWLNRHGDSRSAEMTVTSLAMLPPILQT